MTGNKFEITVFGAKWCPKCRDIADIIGESGLQSKNVLLDDNPEDIEKLKEETHASYVPAIKIKERIVLGYYPRQLEILLGARLKARSHPHHPLNRKTSQER